MQLTQETTARPKGNPADSPRKTARRALKGLIVMPLSEQRGGGELMFLNLIEHGRNYGIDWSAAFFSDGPMVEQTRGWGLPTWILNAGRMRHLHRLAAAICKLVILIRRNKFDVVISFMGKGQIYGGSAAALSGVPAVWYQLGLPSPPGYQDRIASAIPAKLVLTCSKSAATAQAAVWPGRRVETIYPGVELDRFDSAKLPKPADCRRKLGLPLSGPLIAIVGRLQHWKGIHLLIDAMPSVLLQYPEAHAVIVGGAHAFEPEYPDQLKAQITRLGLDSHVTLAGLQSNVPEWMQAADILVHASENEPFGIVVIEAMALGKPVAAASTAGPVEIISNEMNGLLWDTADPENLASAILRFLNNRAWAENIGLQARTRARQFDSSLFASRIVSAVTDLMPATGAGAFVG